jgi:hypothetical protein
MEVQINLYVIFHRELKASVHHDLKVDIDHKLKGNIQ